MNSHLQHARALRAYHTAIEAVEDAHKPLTAQNLHEECQRGAMIHNGLGNVNWALAYETVMNAMKAL